MKHEGEHEETAAHKAGAGIDMTGEVITIQEDDLGRLYTDPVELWKMRVDETGWVVGLPGLDQMWGVLDRLTPGQDVLVSLDPNFPGFVDVFEPLGQTRAGKMPALGKGVMLGWNEECQDLVRPVGEIPEAEWKAAEACPEIVEVYGRDAEGRVAVYLREPNNGWFAIASGLPGRPVGQVVEWVFLSEEAEVGGVSEAPGADCGPFLAPESPSEASDESRMGGECGRGAATPPSYARRAAAEGCDEGAAAETGI